MAADYTVRLILVAGGWHWYAVEDTGRCATLWDAVNQAYRAMKEKLNEEHSTLW